MTVQVRCIRPFSQYEVGDTEEVPDGAAFDPFHWEIALITATQKREPSREVGLIDEDEEPPAAPVPQLPYPPKEM